jgi:hypothetical protein
MQSVQFSASPFLPFGTDPDEAVPSGYANPYASAGTPQFSYVEVESNYFIKDSTWAPDAAAAFYTSHNGSSAAGVYSTTAGGLLYVAELMARSIGVLIPQNTNLGLARMRIIRISTGAEVYNQTFNSNGPAARAGAPDNDTPQLLASLGVYARYRVELSDVDGGIVAFDTIRLYA